MWAKTIEPSCSSSSSESLMSGNCWIVGIRWSWQGILTEFWNLNRNSSESGFAWFTATLEHCTHVQGTSAIIISGQKNTAFLIKNTPSRAASVLVVQFPNAFLTPEPEQFSDGLSEPHISWIPSDVVFCCFLFLCFCPLFFSSPLKQDQPQERDSKWNYCLFFLLFKAGMSNNWVLIWMKITVNCQVIMYCTRNLLALIWAALTDSIANVSEAISMVNH